MLLTSLVRVADNRRLTGPPDWTSVKIFVPDMFPFRRSQQAGGRAQNTSSETRMRAAGGATAQGTMRTEVKSAAEPLVAVESPRCITRTGVKYVLVSTASSQYSEGAPAACTFLALQAAHTVLAVLVDCPGQFERKGFLELYAFEVLDAVLQKAKSYKSSEHQSFADVFSEADSVALRRVDLEGVQANLADLDELCARGDKLRSTHRRSFAAVLTAQSQSICIVWPMGTAEAFVYDSHPRPEPLDPHRPEQNTGTAFRFFDNSRALCTYLDFLFSSADQSKMGVLSDDERAQLAVLSMADANYLFVGDCDLEPCTAFKVDLKSNFEACSCGHAKAAHQATQADARTLLVKSEPNFSRGSAKAPAVVQHILTAMRAIMPSAPRCKSAFLCPDGIDCPRQHSQREIDFFQRHNGRPPPNYKTEQCRFFRDGGHCKYMADNQLCGYAHGEADAICKKCSIKGHWTHSCPAMQIDDAQRPSTTPTSAASAAALAGDLAALKAELLRTQRERDHALGECARLRDSQGEFATAQLRLLSQAAQIDNLTKLATDLGEAKEAVAGLNLQLTFQLREQTTRLAALSQALNRSEQRIAGEQQRSQDLEGRIVALEMEIAALRKTVTPSPQVVQPVQPAANCCDMEAHRHRPGHSPRSFYEPVDGADAETQLQRAVEFSRAATPRSTGEQAMPLEAARLAADRRLAESFQESERQWQLDRQAAEQLYEQDRLHVEQERHQLELSRQAAEQLHEQDLYVESYHAAAAELETSRRMAELLHEHEQQQQNIVELSRQAVEQQLLQEQREVEASLRAAELLQASFAFTCAICQEEFDISDKLIVDCCNKEICRECLQRYVAGEFESRRFPVRCLFSPECGDQLSESTLNLIATDEQLELLREWSRRPILGSHQCPAPNCTGYSLQDDGADVHCQCLLCHHQWCSGEGCEQADLVHSQHAGITCEAYAQWRRDNSEGDARFADFVATHLTDNGADRMRKCPQCGLPQMKDKKCNHVVCQQCRCHWCFRCAAFHGTDADAVYNHQPNCRGQ